LAVELYNTLFAAAGTRLDGLADRASAEAWVASLAPRLPTGGKGTGPKPADLIALRQAVRETLQAVIDGVPAPRASIDTVNRCCARAPRSRVARWSAHARLVRDWDFGGASRADVVLSAIAADTIELITGPDAASLRLCGAPGCVLMFVRDHPRREWCSGSCGNRARQARHYRRTHERAPS
jgi:predicted RNA-binding Zn ribbon-like protein